MRPAKIQNLSTNPGTNQTANNNQNNHSNQNAWRAYDMSMTSSKPAQPTGHTGSTQHSRHASNRFATSQMQMHQNTQQFGTIVHPSIIKTNNLMMDSLI